MELNIILGILSIFTLVLAILMFTFFQKIINNYREDIKRQQEQNNQLINLMNFKQPIVPDIPDREMTDEALKLMREIEDTKDERLQP